MSVLYAWKLFISIAQKNSDLLTMGFEVNAESWKKCLTCSLSAAAKSRYFVSFINIAYIEKKHVFRFWAYPVYTCTL